VIKSQGPQVKKHHKDSTQQVIAERLRPEWRQRLVDAERGITFGIRLDSTFFHSLFYRERRHSSRNVAGVIGDALGHHCTGDDNRSLRPDV